MLGLLSRLLLHIASRRILISSQNKTSLRKKEKKEFLLFSQWKKKNPKKKHIWIFIDEKNFMNARKWTINKQFLMRINNIYGGNGRVHRCTMNNIFKDEESTIVRLLNKPINQNESNVDKPSGS